MATWGKFQDGFGEVLGLSEGRPGISPANPQMHFDALNAVEGVNFGVDSALPHATVETGGRGR